MVVVVAAAAVVVVVAWVDPQLQGAEGVVAQNVLWLEGVVVEGPLGLEVGVPGELVGAAHLPKVQGAVDQNDPCYFPQKGAGEAGSLLGMVVVAVEVALRRGNNTAIIILSFQACFTHCRIGTQLTNSQFKQ